MNVGSLSFRQIENILKDNGFKKIEQNKHVKFKNDKGDLISLPYHSKAMSMKTVMREFKKFDIKI